MIQAKIEIVEIVVAVFVDEGLHKTECISLGYSSPIYEEKGCVYTYVY